MDIRIQKVKEDLEKDIKKQGLFAAVDIDSLKYFLGDTGNEALINAINVLPQARFLVIRIGYDFAYKR